MKAAVLEAVERIVIKEVPEPEPGRGEVLVGVKTCGLCSTDLKLYRGHYSAKLPVVPGHEFAGEVAGVGEGVLDLKVGDRVAVDPNMGCGVCVWCRSGRPCFCKDMAAYGVLRDGGFAEYVCVNRKAVHNIPEGLDYAIASFAEPVSCVVHAIDRASITLGENVLILGGGPTGQILLQVAKLAGAAELMLVTRSRWKLALATGFGATGLINASEVDVLTAVMDMTSGMGADVVIETAGSRETIEQALHLAKPGGRVVIFGLLPQGEVARFVPFEVLSRELSILGSWINPYTFGRALDVLASGRVNPAPLISKELGLDDVAEGLKLMAEKPEGFMKSLVRLP